MKKENKKTLVILDAHALIHRSYHALPSFASSAGEPMGAVYGVSAVLLKLIRELQPSHIAAAFDRAEPTFRHIAYEQYKATRQETKSDLIPQFDKTKEVFAAFGIPLFEIAGFEADDLIGTLVEIFKKEKDLTIIIASGDMDTMQLIDDEKVLVYTLRKGIEDTILYDEKKVVERYGFGPKSIVDYKGLKGDPSDNIIGIKGIGEKTATLLIRRYGSIEDIYTELKKEKKHPRWLTERIEKLLIENEEEALFSKELATVRRDAPLKPTMDSLIFPGIPVEEVSRIFRKLNFPSLINRLPALVGQTEQSVAVLPAREGLPALAGKDSWVAFEKEAGGSKEIGLWSENEKLYIATREQQITLGGEDIKAVRGKLQKFLATPRIVITYDAKTVFHFLSHSFEIAFDTSIARWLCDPDRQALSLSDALHDELPSGKATLPEGLFALESKLRQKLEKQKLSNIYFEFELPLIRILALMEDTGILVDTKRLSVLEENAKRKIASLEKEICAQAGERFDANSPKQLSRILFDVLKLPSKGIKKTPTKSISTQISELVKLRGAHPIIDLLIRYREVAKLFSTYITVLPQIASPSDGRVHTTFNQTGTATGRLSSANPNLQNIPIRTELGKDVRRAFIPTKNYILVSFDYSQLELRIAAQLSGDKELIRAFQEGADIHARTAVAIFRVTPDQVTSEMRRHAKTINFGILYGMGARSLAVGMGVDYHDAEMYLAEYLKTFSGIEEYRERVVSEGRRIGYVETFFGRKRYIPNLKSSFDFVRKEAERMAMNAPIQGTNADIIKRAMIDIARTLELSRDNPRVRLLLQVHDELLFEIRDDALAEAVPVIREIMQRVREFTVPIVVEPRSGSNWQDMTVMK